MTDLTPGAALAAMRRTVTKQCPECGEMFTGLARVVYCRRCANKLRVRRHRQKIKSERIMSTKLIPTNKLNFVRSISRMRLNNIGANIYTGKTGSAYIVCDKLTQQIPYANIKFESLDALENWLDQIPGNSAGVLDTVLERLLTKNA